MTGKLAAQGIHIDWKKVELATEVPRTYLIRDSSGREFFKMYKPSESQRIFKSKGWTGQIVSTLYGDKAGNRL